MILRRVIALAALPAIACAVARAEPLTADRLPAALLAECDARAAPIGRAEPAIAESVRALTAIGAFSAAEFDGVRFGFCPLQREGGPVGVTSCKDDIILLDEKYQSAGEALVLHATLAHEMAHVLQHRAARARAGAGYCDSAAYLAAKPALEGAADALGDGAAALLALGREVEIVNLCDAPVSIYLEADDPAARPTAPAFVKSPPGRAVTAKDRALSGNVRFYARTAPENGPAHVWEEKSGADARFVEGRLVRLKAAQLAAADRLASPLRLRLSCRSEKDRR